MNNSKRVRKFNNPISIFWGILFAALLYNLIPILTADGTTSSIGKKLLVDTPQEAGIPNAVTAVVVYFRGLDTLGEVSVVFIVATALGLILGLRGSRGKDPETRPNAVVAHAKTLLLPNLILTGLYITVHGHLTPGGGFQGGVMAAGISLLLLLSGDRINNMHVVHTVEGLVGSLYALVAISGIWLGTSFLSNYLLPTDVNASFGRLISGGIIPVLYIFIGIKVGTEIVGIYQNFQPKESEDVND